MMKPKDLVYDLKLKRNMKYKSSLKQMNSKS